MDTNLVIKQIEEIEQKIEKSKGLLSKAEGKLEMLEQQKQQIIGEIHNLGLKPEDLAHTIQSLEIEINKDLTEITNSIPDFVE